MDHTIPHNDIKLIVLDLDGTLLNSKKELSPGNFAALEAAAAKGIYVVPCTGRFFNFWRPFWCSRPMWPAPAV